MMTRFQRFLYLLPVFIHRLTGWLPFQPKPGKFQFANTVPLAKCAAILGVEPDEKLKPLVDEIHALASIVVEGYCEHRKKLGPASPGFSEALTLIPEGDRYEVEERAGILEYEGGLDRDTAERTAVQDHARRNRKVNR